MTNEMSRDLLTILICFGFGWIALDRIVQRAIVRWHHLKYQFLRELGTMKGERE